MQKSSPNLEFLAPIGSPNLSFVIPLELSFALPKISALLILSDSLFAPNSCSFLL